MSAALEDDGPASSTPAHAAERLRVGGRVQGVGFRPYVYRLARLHELGGWARNHGGEVDIVIEGPADGLRAFKRALLSQAPPAAAPQLLQARPVPGEGRREFCILASTRDGEPRIHIPADLFTCDECLAELNDPRARRHRYPFINCTQCGPRYTLIRAMPYDRANTTLDRFTLCERLRGGVRRSDGSALPRGAVGVCRLRPGALLAGREPGHRRQRACAGSRARRPARRTDRRRARGRRLSPHVRCAQ